MATTKCIFICGLHNIEVREDLGEGIKLVPHEKNVELPIITITNNKEKIKSLFDTKFPYFIGAIEYRHLLDGYPIVAYAEGEFDSEKVSSIQHLNLHLYLLKIYFFCLWMTKDNAADFDIGFLQFTNAEGEVEVSANNMTTSNSNVSGERMVTEFSIDELNTASKYLKDFIQIEHKDKPKIAISSSLSRISIANYFIQSAINATDLGLKSVGYCSALETLFANGENTELAHKLSERVSKFLKAELDDRKSIYKTVKKIYEIRSKVVHGATFKPQKIKDLVSIIEEVDQICRDVMIYALTTTDEENVFLKTSEELGDYFLELILK